MCKRNLGCIRCTIFIHRWINLSHLIECLQHQTTLVFVCCHFIHDEEESHATSAMMLNTYVNIWCAVVDRWRSLVEQQMS